MNGQISSGLRTTFLVHLIISALLGTALWLVPGRTLALLGWVPEWVQLPESDLSIPGQTFVDATITRVMGAAMLALAYSSYRGWRSQKWGEVSLVVQLELVFCILGFIAFLVGAMLVERGLPVTGWVLMVILAAFALAWGWALKRGH